VRGDSTLLAEAAGFGGRELRTFRTAYHVGLEKTEARSRPPGATDDVICAARFGT
jgi:hypothetical protein